MLLRCKCENSWLSEVAGRATDQYLTEQLAAVTALLAGAVPHPVDGPRCQPL